MAYIRRIEPEPPERSQMQIILEELRDCFAIMELLSLRLARLEAQSPDNRPQTRRERPS
jgi:hypothetical protein